MNYLYTHDAADTVARCIISGAGAEIAFHHNHFSFEIHQRTIPEPDFPKPGGRPYVKDYPGQYAVWRAAKNIYDGNVGAWNTNRLQNIEERKTVRRLGRIQRMLEKMK